MIRQIITINQEKCNGCGLCVEACHESAIGLIDGKATLLRDDYCDGLGDCLPVCPTDAISFEKRESKAYDALAVQENMHKKASQTSPSRVSISACPGSKVARFNRSTTAPSAKEENLSSTESKTPMKSQLNQWPIQIKLVPVKADFFDQAHLLVAADCTAFAYGNFHDHFIKNHVTLIGCPKLDQGDYSDKLREIIMSNDIQDITVVKMEVPCCNGIMNAVKTALGKSGKVIPWQVKTISIDGQLKG